MTPNPPRVSALWRYAASAVGPTEICWSARYQTDQAFSSSRGKGIDGNGKPTSIQASYSMDGRQHPIIGSPDVDSQSIKRVDALTTEGTLKKSGKVIQTVRREITKDGKTMTITFKGANARGETIYNIIVFEKR